MQNPGSDAGVFVSFPLTMETFRLLIERKFPLLPKAALIERLEFVVSCYRRAIEVIPERPRRPVKDDDDPRFPFWC
jgi:hypothetical protein